MQDPYDGSFLQPHNHAVGQRRDRQKAPRLPRHASLAEEIPAFGKRDHGFFSMLGNNSELDLAALNVKHRIGKIALREIRLIFPIFAYCLTHARFGEKSLGVERQASPAFWNISSHQNATSI